MTPASAPASARARLAPAPPITRPSPGASQARDELSTGVAASVWSPRAARPSSVTLAPLSPHRCLAPRHEVDVPERRPLGLDGGAELVDLRFTFLIRSGSFLTVWTPSGVRVESMMYVGMAAPAIGISVSLRRDLVWRTALGAVAVVPIEEKECLSAISVDGKQAFGPRVVHQGITIYDARMRKNLRSTRRTGSARASHASAQAKSKGCVNGACARGCSGPPTGPN